MKVSSKTLQFFIHSSVLFILLVPVWVFAQPVGLENPIGVDSISGLIRIVVKVIRYIAIPFVVVMIMYAGFLYIWNGRNGDSKGVGEAHEALRWVVIGSFVILSAEVIAIVIENTLKSIK
jgi:hypothetical protein